MTMSHGGSEINVANIALAIVVPIVAGLVSAAVTHSLAHERTKRDMARQMTLDILRGLSRVRSAIMRYHAGHGLWVSLQKHPQPALLQHYPDFTAALREFADACFDLYAIGSALSFVYGTKGTKLSSMLQEFANLKHTEAEGDEFCAFFDTAAKMRNDLIDEIAKVNKTAFASILEEAVA